MPNLQSRNVINIKSVSTNATTYSKSTSGGATVTLTTAPGNSVAQYGYNNVNALISIASGGATKFLGTSSKALKLATVNSIPAKLSWSKSFDENATLSSGSNSVPISVTDGANSVKTDTSLTAVTGPTSTSVTFDANGNMTSDETNSYAWDAENRLTKIIYSGSNNYSQFYYDAVGDRIKIVETTSNVISSTRQFIWSKEPQPLEVRDASNNIVDQFYARGQVQSGILSYFLFDHLGSVRARTNYAASIVSQTDFGPYGTVTTLHGSASDGIQYAGYYTHQRSGLNLTLFRGYSPTLGRWISRDPIEEDGGVNLFAFVNNNPIDLVDLFGDEVTSDGTDGYPSGAIYHADGTVTMPSGRPVKPSTHGCELGSCPISVQKIIEAEAAKRDEKIRQVKEEAVKKKNKKQCPAKKSK